MGISTKQQLENADEFLSLLLIKRRRQMCVSKTNEQASTDKKYLLPRLLLPNQLYIVCVCVCVCVCLNS